MVEARQRLPSRQFTLKPECSQICHGFPNAAARGGSSTVTKDRPPIASWRVTRDGLLVWFDQRQAIIPFGEFGGLVLALLTRMKDREGR